MQTHSTAALTQSVLPLDGGPSSSALQDAYDATLLRSNGITFERALTVPHIKLSLERLAQAMVKARRAA